MKVVLYHGSLVDQHGVWFLLKTASNGSVLVKDKDAFDGTVLRNVRPSSYTVID